MSTICLSMIVKNEAHCIKKCLESVRKHINYYVICDTGSTDNTKEIIKEVLKDIPGEIHDHEWKNFAHNRNLALNLSKKHCNYSLIIDADDYLVVQNPNTFKKLTEECYKMKIIHSSITYFRNQIVRNNVPAEYVGVLHEYLKCSNMHNSKDLRTCHMVFGGTGNRSTSKDKYLQDIKILEQGIIDEPNNERYVFYLAQSYRDAGIYDKAYENYIKRTSMGGWSEEQYISMLEAGKILDSNENNADKIEQHYIMTYSFAPNRSEAFYYLAKYFRLKKDFYKSYFYATIGMQIKKPIESLFLQDDCYDWQLMDEAAVAAYYINKPTEGLHYNKMLLQNNKLPPNEKDRIITNYNFCKNL